MRATPCRRGLTLGELLAVLGVLAVLLALLFITVSSARKSAPPDDTRADTSKSPWPAEPTYKEHILFVGNSYTYYHNMPLMVVALAKAAGEPAVMGVEVTAPGGSTLQQHYQGGEFHERLRSQKYAFVVLQEQSAGPLDNPAAMLEFGKLLDEDVKKAGAKTVLYLTWARQDAPQTQDAITAQYLALARQLEARVAPVGVAWQLWLKDHPNRPLHDKDGSHPNPRGAFLTACVFYATFYAKSPVGLSATSNGGDKAIVDLPEEQVRALEETAWAAVQQLRK
jgi:hypothetical protein